MSVACKRPIFEEYFSLATTLSKEETNDSVDSEEHGSLSNMQIVPIYFENDLMLTNEKGKEREDKKDNLLPGMWKFSILPCNIYMIGVK